MKLYNTSGILRKQQTDSSDMDLADMPRGLYIARKQHSDRSVETTKMMKR